MRAVRRPLWLKLAAASVVIATVPALALGFGLMDINAETLRTDSRDFRLAIAEDIAESVETDLAQAQRTIAAVSHILGDPNTPAEGRLQLIQTLIGLDEAVDQVDIYDQDRRLIDRIVETDAQPPQASQTLDVQAFSVRFHNNRARVAMVLPIRPADPTGFVVAYVPLDRVQQRTADIARDRIPPGSNVFVTDVAGQILVHSAPQHIGTTARQNEVLKDLDQLISKGVAASGESNQATTLTSVKPLQKVPWLVAVELPLEVAYASLHDMRRLVVLATIVASLLAAAAAFLSARALTSPLKKLLELVAHLAQRQFSARCDVDTQDELGVLAGALNNAAQGLEESEATIRKEIEIRADLSRYLSKELVDTIVAREQDMSLGGQHRQITVLFADVVRFTPMCEALKPEVIVSILNELFTMLTEIVFKHGGTVDKFVGDCVMAFWGAPREDEHHAAHALDAAEEMLSWLEINNARWKKQHDVTIQLAIGVNSGQAIVGNVGSKTRMEYTAIGNIVNIAARLEALARPQQILTTNHTRSIAGKHFEFIKIGDEPIGANQGLVEVYEVAL